VITDYDGNEMFVLLDQDNGMRSYEAVFGDLDGRRLVCVKRHLQRAFWRDGFYFCTYKPNYAGQRPLTEHDVDNKKLYPFSYLQVSPLKGRFFYRLFNADEELDAPKMKAENQWLGFMSVCCTPAVRCGNWTAEFKKARSDKAMIYVDQWKNVVDVGPGNDLLSALCMAYVFDRVQCQPLVTVMGERDSELEGDDDDSSSSSEETDSKNDGSKKSGDQDIELTNMKKKEKPKDKRVNHGGTGNVAYPKKPLRQDERFDRRAPQKKAEKVKKDEPAADDVSEDSGPQVHPGVMAEGNNLIGDSDSEGDAPEIPFGDTLGPPQII
jgi:hypothetical protein